MFAIVIANAVLASYAIVAFVGLRASLVDIWVNVVSWLYRPQRYESTHLNPFKPDPAAASERPPEAGGGEAFGPLSCGPPHDAGTPAMLG